MNGAPLGGRSRAAALATTAAGAVAALVAGVVAPEHGVLSAALGTAMVVIFFGAGALPFAVAGDGTGGRGALGFAVLGMTYVLRILAGVLVYATASTSDAVNNRVVGLTVIACALVWVNTQLVLGLSRRHQPALDR